MFVECKNEDGFEDQLTSDLIYRVKAIGENSYLLTNDKGEEFWYGQQHFTIGKINL